MINTKKENFVITGKLQKYTRTEMIKKINDAGGYVHPRITEGVNFLIVGDTGRHGKTNKIMAAEAYGITCISEVDFVEMDPETLKEYISGLRDIREIIDTFNK